MAFEPLSDRFVHSLEPSLTSASSPIHASSPLELFLSDVPDKPLTWLWPGRIPLGHLTLLDATPGCDPSLLALTLAAYISSGKSLPGSEPTPPANVILFAPYDSASATLKPRLQAAGGDPARVLLFRPPVEQTSRIPSLARSFALSSVIDHLSNTIRRLNARLVILDPVSAIPGLLHCLPALGELAQQTNCAILLTRSLSKPPADLLHSSGPTSPLYEAVCSRLLLTPDPADERHHLLITTWHPLSAQPPILACDLLGSDVGIPVIHWLAERDHTHLARLSTAPLHSPHRQAILRFLHNSPTPQSIPSILAATCYDPQAGRKMLTRMKLAGELVCTARGLYTTLNHPSLASLTNDTLPVSNVPTIPDIPSPAVSDVTTPPPSPDPPENHSPQCSAPSPFINLLTDHTTAPIPADSHLSPVPNVTNPADTIDILLQAASHERSLNKTTEMDATHNDL